MKSVFVHDHIFKKVDNKYFSEGQLTSNTWQRYLQFSRSLTVVARCENVGEQSSKKLNLSSSEGVKFHCFNRLGVKERLFSNSMTSKMIEVIEDADVVICRVPSFLGSKAFDIAKKLNKKIILEVVGCPFDSFRTHGSFLGKMLAPIEYFKLKRVVSKSSHAVYVTKFFLQKRYPTKKFSTNASNVELIEHDYKVDLNKEVKIIKFIGSLKAKYKGLADLIKAMGLLKDKGLELELHVLGSGEKKEYLNLIDKLGVKVTFFKPITQGDLIFKWLSTGDIYVQPSHTEGLPRALIEAMSVGLPCVATDVGGIPELLPSDILCKKKSPEELSSKILLIANDKQVRLEKSKQNVKKSKEYLKEAISFRRNKLFSTVYTK